MYKRQLETRIVFRIRHYLQIWKVVNGHKSAAHTDLPMAAPVRRALAEVCTVPVLVVLKCVLRVFGKAACCISIKAFK